MKALSSNKPREIWKIIHWLLKPSPNPIRLDPDNVTYYFVKTAERIPTTQAMPQEDLIHLTVNMNVTAFKLSPVTHGEVLNF